jgi:hypothetical protein
LSRQFLPKKSRPLCITHQAPTFPNLIFGSALKTVQSLSLIARALNATLFLFGSDVRLRADHRQFEHSILFTHPPVFWRSIHRAVIGALLSFSSPEGFERGSVKKRVLHKREKEKEKRELRLSNRRGQKRLELQSGFVRFVGSR